MLSNTFVKLGGVFAVAMPAVFVGGAIYSKLTGGELTDGFLKIYEVLYIIPGAGHANACASAAGAVQHLVPGY